MLGVTLKVQHIELHYVYKRCFLSFLFFLSSFMLLLYLFLAIDKRILTLSCKRTQLNKCNKNREIMTWWNAAESTVNQSTGVLWKREGAGSKWSNNITSCCKMRPFNMKVNLMDIPLFTKTQQFLPFFLPTHTLSSPPCGCWLCWLVRPPSGERQD